MVMHRYLGNRASPKIKNPYFMSAEGFIVSVKLRTEARNT